MCHKTRPYVISIKGYLPLSCSLFVGISKGDFYTCIPHVVLQILLKKEQIVKCLSSENPDNPAAYFSFYVNLLLQSSSSLCC